MFLLKNNFTINKQEKYKHNINTINYSFLDTILTKKETFFKHNILNFNDIIINFNNSTMFLKNILQNKEYYNEITFNIIYTKHIINIFNIEVFNNKPVLIITQKEYIKYIELYLKDKSFIVLKNKNDKINKINNYKFIIITNNTNIPANIKWNYIIHLFVKNFNYNYKSDNNLFLINNIELVDECYQNIFKDNLINNYYKILKTCIFKIKGNYKTQKFDIDKRISKYINNSEFMLYNTIEESIFNYKIVNELLFKQKYLDIYNKYTHNPECSICLCKIDKHKLSFLDCGHYYCTQCININSKIFKKCPQCRTNYTSHYKLSYSDKIKYLQNLKFKKILIVCENNKITKLLKTILDSCAILKLKKTLNKKYYITNPKNYITLNKNVFEKIIFLDDINIIDNYNKITYLENNFI